MGCPAVSVVIPVYNGEPYLEGCIRFLKSQTFTDFEVIFVIDVRCTDDTLSRQDELRSAFPGCRIILQDKGFRQGGNRNLGLDAAQGDMVWFMDVDDAPCPEFLEEMVSLLCGTGSDFVCCNFINTGVGGTIRGRPDKVFHAQVLSRSEAIEFCNLGMMPIAPWNKVFRRDFLISRGLRFEDIGAEDVLFTYALLDACDSVCVYDKPLYAYRQNPNSVCRDRSDLDRRGREEIQAYDRVDELFPDMRSVLVHSAVMKIRSSTHMTRSAAVAYARSGKNRETYDALLKGLPEAAWQMHLPTLYFIAVRVYVKLIYKRNGSRGVRMKLSDPVDARTLMPGYTK